MTATKNREPHLSAETVALLRAGARPNGLQRVHLLTCTKCRKRVARKESRR